MGSTPSKEERPLRSTINKTTHHHHNNQHHDNFNNNADYLKMLSSCVPVSSQQDSSSSSILDMTHLLRSHESTNGVSATTTTTTSNSNSNNSSTPLFPFPSITMSTSSLKKGGLGGLSTILPLSMSLPSSLPSLSSTFPSVVTRCDGAPPPPPPLLPPPLPSNGTSNKTSPLPPPTPTDAAAPPPPPPTSNNNSETTNNNNTTNEATSSTTTTNKDDSSISSIASNVTSIPNPGPYEMSTGAIRRLTNLDAHDGMRCDVQKQLSPYTVAIHSFWLGTTMPHDGRDKIYSFVTQVADEEGLAMARVDPTLGTVEAHLQRSILGGAAQAKLQMSLSPDVAGGEGGGTDQAVGEIDFGGMTWTGSLKYGTMEGANVFGGSYFQGINERWAAGGEGMYLGSKGECVGSYTLKYECPARSLVAEDTSSTSSSSSTSIVPQEEMGGASLFVGQYHPSMSMLSLNYRRIVTPGDRPGQAFIQQPDQNDESQSPPPPMPLPTSSRVALGTELQCNTATLESSFKLGAEFNLTRSKFNVCFDGADGGWKSTLETKLGSAPGSPRLGFCASVEGPFGGLFGSAAAAAPPGPPGAPPAPAAGGMGTMRFGYNLNIGG